MSAQEALARLIAGNDRVMRGEAREGADLTPEALARLTRGQQPFATILGCSDSRVSPEWLFDARLGELFVIRVAGNIFSPAVAGSLQYANVHLQTPLFVVLGHEGCGAVNAALGTILRGERHGSRIQMLVDSIVPGIFYLTEGHDDGCADAILPQAVEANVRWTVNQIAQTPEGRARLEDGAMKIVGAVYELSSGRVRFLPRTP